eukprot:scaffold313959_cov40-Tisochrysis_lutea.AAC.2
MNRALLRAFGTLNHAPSKLLPLHRLPLDTPTAWPLLCHYRCLRYVEKLEDGWSRVYYSADSQLPSWVPGFAKDRLIGQALRQSTSWVDKYAQLAVGKSVADRPSPFRTMARRLLVIAALIQAKVMILPEVLPQLKLPPALGQTISRILPRLRAIVAHAK